MPILAKLIPFRDYVYAAAAIALVIWYNVHVHNLEVGYAAVRVQVVTDAVAAATVKTLADAKKKADLQAAQYEANLKQVNETYAKQHTDDVAAHNSDLQRMRQLAAQADSQGGGDGSLARPGEPATPADPWRSSLIGLGYVSAELASALHDARNDLGKCYAERASLEGKP